MFTADCAGCAVSDTFVDSQRTAEQAHQRRIRELREALHTGRDHRRYLSDERVPRDRDCRTHRVFTVDCGTCAAADLQPEAHRAAQRRRRELDDIVTQHHRNQQHQGRRRAATASPGTATPGSTGTGGGGGALFGFAVLAAIIAGIWVLLAGLGWVLQHATTAIAVVLAVAVLAFAARAVLRRLLP